MARTWTEEQKQKQRELFAKKKAQKTPLTEKDYEDFGMVAGLVAGLDRNKEIEKLLQVPGKIEELPQIEIIKGSKMFLVSTYKNNKIINADDVRYIELANQKTILFFFKSIGNASTGWVYETVEDRDIDWQRLQRLSL